MLFQKNKKINNPEKEKLRQKRLVIFREPRETDKFQNSFVTELTGSNNLSAKRCTKKIYI